MKSLTRSEKLARKRVLERAYYKRNKEAISARRKTPEFKEKRRAYTKASRKINPKMWRARWLRHQYKLTQEEWDMIFNAQGRACALCKRTKQPGKKGWHTDHCHDTNRVRGILCNRCNRGLGFFNDDPAFLRRAIDYLNT